LQDKPLQTFLSGRKPALPASGDGIDGIEGEVSVGSGLPPASRDHFRFRMFIDFDYLCIDLNNYKL